MSIIGLPSSNGKGRYIGIEGRNGDHREAPEDRMLPVSFNDLAEQHPSLNEVVLDGMLRRGETANIIAPPKTGKSFLAANLAWCVATGRDWLSRPTEQGRVLVIDNELHPSVLVSRYTHVADSLHIGFAERDSIDFLPLRGKNTSLAELSSAAQIKPGQYNLVLLDALYRMVPQGTSENDNAGMMALYNQIDRYAAQWGSAVVVVHHSSKGAQGDKAVTDVGAGAGAISRAADTHIAIRQHETDGHFVLDAVTRSFKSPEPVSIQFEWPLWQATTLAPEVRRQGRSTGQSTKDAEADEKLRKALRDSKGSLSSAQLARLTRMGPSRTERAIERGMEAGWLSSELVIRLGKEVVAYSATVECHGSATASAT